MKKLGRWIKNIFFPPADSSTATRLLPYGIIIIILMALAIGTAKGWEVTNSTEFCGTACHTMPPQYITHQLSDHARVTCDDCHLGRTDLANQIVRKIQYSYQTGSATVMNSYTLPIFAENMRPANDVCETCHYPQTVSSDKLVELKQYREDEANTLYTTHLIMKTGGGTQREGLGFGIHWHIENPVSFIALDEERQEIPYVRVEKTDGSISEFFDVESDFSAADVDESKLESMDCITCHNRAAHAIERPDDKINELMARGEISTDIPYIRNMAGAVFRGEYTTMEEAKAGIYGLIKNYQSNLPQEYTDNKTQIDGVADTLWAYYQTANFMDQKMDWNTHPDNIQHRDSPGCFRCHDGKHLTTENEAVRLECNLCHSVPVISGPEDFVTNIEVSTGVEPDNHKNTNWISMHHDAYDESCQACHTVEDPGGSSDTSFCSNSGCHGQSWEYVGFDAPALRKILKAIMPTPTPQPTLPVLEAGSAISYGDIAGLFTKCIGCHSDAIAQKGVNLSSFDAIMAGGNDGPVVIVGDADNSSLVGIQSGSNPHFGQFSSLELDLVKAWINSGANLTNK